MQERWSEEQARWIVRRAATLALAGAEPVGPIVLPDARFFPDKFDRRPESIGKLFERMKLHVGLSDTDTSLSLVDPEEGRVVSSCSSGGCGGGGVSTLSGERVTVRRGAGGALGYDVVVAIQEVANPTVLTTALARALGQVFLFEADVASRFAPKEIAPAADLAAVLLGLGVIVTNGSAIEVKGCGGMKVHGATSLGPAEAVLALALACEREGQRGRELPAGLEAGLDRIARSMFGMARAFVHENRAVVRRLDDGAEALEQDKFTLREAGSSIGGRIKKLFGMKAASTDPLEALEREAASAPKSAGTRAGAKPKNDARLEEIRALVEESFEQG